MLPASHLLLGRTLAKKTPALSRHPIRKGAFLIGNIAPDFVPHTFFQESRLPRLTGGHCLPYSAPKIERKIKKCLVTGLYSVFDAFRLGVLMHYLADSFTYPHTTKQRLKHKIHQDYEEKLKTTLPEFLSVADRTEPDASPKFLAESRRQFDAIPPSTERDAEWIVCACSAVFLKIASI